MNYDDQYIIYNYDIFYTIKHFHHLHDHKSTILEITDYISFEGVAKILSLGRGQDRATLPTQILHHCPDCQVQEEGTLCMIEEQNWTHGMFIKYEYHNRIAHKKESNWSIYIHKL